MPDHTRPKSFCLHPSHPPYLLSLPIQFHLYSNFRLIKLKYYHPHVSFWISNISTSCVCVWNFGLYIGLPLFLHSMHLGLSTESLFLSFSTCVKCQLYYLLFCQPRFSYSFNTYSPFTAFTIYFSLYFLSHIFKLVSSL